MKVVFVLFMVLAAGVLAFLAFEEVAGALLTVEVACPQFCELHYEGAEDYPRRAWVPGWLPGSDVSWSDIITNEFDKLKENMAEPESMGCFCGVEETTGKYIHLQGTEEKIEEFHLTDDNPGFHLASEADEFDHTGALEACEKVIDNEGMQFEPVAHSLEDLRYEQSCTIISEDGNGGCIIWRFDEGFVVEGSEGTFWEEAEEQDRTVGYHASGRNRAEDPVYSLEFGDEVDMGEKHFSQRMLLENFEEGEDREFNLSSPIVCRTTQREEMAVRDELDRLCKDYCKDEHRFFWGSRCYDGSPGDYERLPEEYKEGVPEEVSLCPEAGEEPQCLCVDRREYYWEVDHQIEDMKEYIFGPNPEDGAGDMPTDTQISFYIDFENYPVEVEVSSADPGFETFTVTETESGEVVLGEEWQEESDLLKETEYIWEVSVTNDLGQTFTRSFSFTTED